jgi:hypothetical protein
VFLVEVRWVRSTSGSGDFGKLVVKRESNSGIAGGC